MRKFIAVSEKPERSQAEHFSLRFGCDLERIPQGPEVAGDYRIMETSDFTKELETALGYPLKGRVLEFKDDRASLKYGTLFCEFEQTNDSWFTRKPSGHALAILKGCILIISSGSRCFVFNEESYRCFVNGSIRERCTKYRRNGNNPGSFSRGKIVPVPHASKTASFSYNMAQKAGLHAIAL